MYFWTLTFISSAEKGKIFIFGTNSFIKNQILREHFQPSLKNGTIYVVKMAIFGLMWTKRPQRAVYLTTSVMFIKTFWIDIQRTVYKNPPELAQI